MFMGSIAVHVYRLSTGEKVHGQGHISNSPVVSAVFVPRQTPASERTVPWLKQSTLYFLNTRQELLSLDSESEAQAQKKTYVDVS